MRETRPFGVLLNQKVAVIRIIHGSNSEIAQALEIETKQGRVVHIKASDMMIVAGAFPIDVLSTNKPSELTRHDLTEQLPFVFQSDQFVVRVECFSEESDSCVLRNMWQLTFSSEDFFVILNRDDELKISSNIYPNALRRQT